VVQPAPQQAAAAPISLAAPVVLPPLPNPTAPAAPQPRSDAAPWSALLAPTSVAASPQPDLRAPPPRNPPVVLAAPAETQAAPSALVAGSSTMQPVVLGHAVVSETDAAYTGADSGPSVRVVSDSYTPPPGMGTTTFFHTKY
jgi:hypothetical protein